MASLHTKWFIWKVIFTSQFYNVVIFELPMLSIPLYLLILLNNYWKLKIHFVQGYIPVVHLSQSCLVYQQIPSHPVHKRKTQLYHHYYIQTVCNDSNVEFHEDRIRRFVDTFFCVNYFTHFTQTYISLILLKHTFHSFYSNIHFTHFTQTYISLILLKHTFHSFYSNIGIRTCISRDVWYIMNFIPPSKLCFKDYQKWVKL